ncbi:redoxin family protein [Bdellovibrio bacteriovorus]|uniref:redoxin family protein n=1 Tax=Bdellovibrio bacteriovorus TaxID=959 RepID=UPI0035A72ABE
MLRLSTLILLTLWASLSWALPAFDGSDVTSQKEFKFSTADKEATVLIFVSAKCPCSASHESLLKNLATEYKDMQFVGVHSNSDETLEETKQHFAEAQLPFPVIQDRKSKLANELGALKTPHAFVFNKKGELVYHGGVTDSHVGPSAKKFFLKEVLEDIHAGKAPRHKEGRALGCYIQREDS